MNIDEKRISGAIRGVSPCTGCNERFYACWDHCPKDERGEFGYKAWKAKINEVKKARRHYAEFATNNGYKYHWEDYGD